jgi:hypothetical protein
MFQTRLMEGDAGKLADPSHAAKSPKYDFLQLASQNKYNYDQLPEMLQALQSGPNGSHWTGWTADKDKFKFTGDPSQLGAAWNGVKEVDAVGAFNSGNPTGWRWGADDGGQVQAQMPQMGMSSVFNQPTLAPSAAPSDPASSSALLQQILAELNGNPSLKKALEY